MDADGEKVRIDKWLWAARFFKARSLATEAVDGGKVEINGQRAKPAKLVGAGDEVRLRVGQALHVLKVLDVGERRGPASVAQSLYEETEESRRDRERLSEQLRLSAQSLSFDEGRPSKRDRREIRKFRGR